jgi:hypothetical protein
LDEGGDCVEVVSASFGLEVEEHLAGDYALSDEEWLFAVEVWGFVIAVDSHELWDAS